MALKLILLGAFQVLLDNRPAVFATDRARALLAYLAVEANRPHRRDFLAELLWPERPETVARQNLSQTLVRVRRAIDDYHASPPFLRITSKTIQLDSDNVDLDVTHFLSLLATNSNHNHPELNKCSACFERFEQAVEYYQGPFLEGMFLRDSQLFVEWVLLKREQLHRQVLNALYTLAACYLEAEVYDLAQRNAERQLALEPWREEAHRQLMQALALSGRRAAALAQFKICRRVLVNELGVEPSAETTALYERILAD